MGLMKVSTETVPDWIWQLISVLFQYVRYVRRINFLQNWLCQRLCSCLAVMGAAGATRGGNPSSCLLALLGGCNAGHRGLSLVLSRLNSMSRSLCRFYELLSSWGALPVWPGPALAGKQAFQWASLGSPERQPIPTNHPTDQSRVPLQLWNTAQLWDTIQLLSTRCQIIV